MAHEVKLTMDGLLINWLKACRRRRQRGRYHRRIRSRQSDRGELKRAAPANCWNCAPSRVTSWAKARSLPLIGAAGESAATQESVTPEAQSSATEAEATAPTNGQTMAADGRIKASPLARRIAADKGIDLSRVQGTGPGGRIVKSDVENLSAQPQLPPLPAAPPTAAAGQATWGKLPERRCRSHPPVADAAGDRRWHGAQQKQYTPLLRYSRGRCRAAAGAASGDQQRAGRARHQGQRQRHAHQGAGAELCAPFPI